MQSFLALYIFTLVRVEWNFLAVVVYLLLHLVKKFIYQTRLRGAVREPAYARLVCFIISRQTVCLSATIGQTRDA